MREREREGTWSWEAREKPGGSGMSREEGDAELSVKSTPHLLPPTITPFPFSIFPSQIEIWSLSLATASFCFFKSSNWLGLAFAYSFFFFFGVWFLFLLFSAGPCGFNNIYMGPNRLHWAGPVLFLIRLPNFGVPTYWLTPRDGKNVPTCLICYVLLWSNVRVT